MAEYGHPSMPGYVYDIMPVLQPMVTIIARSTVNVVRGGQTYSTDTANDVWGLSDPETGDTDVASCAVAAWTPRGVR